MINVGIFWVINKQIYYRIESKKQEEINKELIAPLGIIDSSYGHFIEWEKKEKFLFLNDDFSTYPRGRVLFNIKNNSHIIYVDDCIKKDEIKQIVKLFGITNYVTKKDLHYSCDKCIIKKNLYEKF